MTCAFCNLKLEPYFSDFETKTVSDPKPQVYFNQQTVPIAWTERTGRIIEFYFCPCCGFVEDKKI